MLKLVQSKPDQFQGLQPLFDSRLFRAMPEAVTQTMASTASKLCLRKNETLFIQNDRADWFYFILSGWVKIYRETQDGNEAVIELLSAGDFVGEHTFLEENIYSSNAAATDKVTLLRLPVSLLKQAVNNDHKAALAMLQSYAAKRQRQTQELEGLKLQDAPQRIGCFLLRACGGNTSGVQRVQLPYGKSLIAMQLGMKGETFSRALGKLKKATAVVVEKSRVTVPDIAVLADYVCAGCSNEYPCKDLVRAKQRHA